MAHGIETKRALRAAFVYQSLGLEAAAERADVSFGTASRWKREAKAEGDDWDKARSAKMMSAEGTEAIMQTVLEEFILIFKSGIAELKEGKEGAAPISPIARAEAIVKLSDGFSKVMSIARKGSPEINKLAIGMDVIKLFADFIAERYPQHAPIFIEILEPFGQHLSQVLTS